MKVPLSWLREFVAVEMSAGELADRLALTGTEVERVSRVGIPADDGNLERFVIGRVKTVEPHPDADRLVLCQVDIGGETSQIICGAKNFGEGDKVAVCIPGGTLPDGRTLEAAEIRGVESHGMMCSEAELGLATESPGIMVLPEDAPVGEKLNDYIPVSDEVLELEVTPNRPDCLSIYGVAREVAAITGTELAPEPVADVEAAAGGGIDDFIEISVDDPDLCLRYGARLIKGVNIGESPAWLKARIVAAGMRPVNNVVDITNYVMWTLGEPMHAFDLAKIAGGRLVARRARDGEKLVTIDGTERTLTGEMLVIADAEKPSAVAGIMGSEASEVTEDTTDILLEAANFHGPNILATSMELGLRSDSSTRFEKGLDPELVPRALAMASRMMVELCGGSLVPGQVDIYAEPMQKGVVHLRQEKLSGLLGIDIPGEEAQAILGRLGFEVETEAEGLRAVVPSFRADVEREVDLVEEVARVFGLDLIPPTLPSEMRVLGGLSARQQAERDISRTLAARGLNEVITYTFVPGNFADRLRLLEDDPRRRALRLSNPLSVEQSVMRTLMLPSLLDIVAGNLSQRNRDVNIFELGRVYLPREGGKLPDERRAVGGCLCGSLAGETWLGGGGDSGYFTAKGLVEAVFATVRGEFDTRAAREPFLHPGKSADIYIGGAAAGYLGEVHPLVLKAHGIEQPVTAFEIDEQALLENAAGIVQFEDLITYPASFQDIAVIVDADITADQVLDTVRQAGSELLHSARVFDIYEGEQVGEGRRSIALRLEFRSPERTLTDAEVDAAREKIVSALAEAHGAELRT